PGEPRVALIAFVVRYLYHATTVPSGTHGVVPSTNARMPWTRLGMRTNASSSTKGNRPGMASQYSMAVRPAGVGTTVPPTTGPNRHARPWVQMVTKYAADCE